MKRTILVVAILALAASSTSPAFARGRRRGRSSVVVTPQGRISTRSKEWRMARGNIQLYQQIKAREQMQKQKKMYTKRVQEQRKHYQQQMQKRKKYLEDLKKNNPAAYAKLQQQYQQKQEAYKDYMKHFEPKPRTVKSSPDNHPDGTDQPRFETAEITPMQPASNDSKAKK